MSVFKRVIGISIFVISSSLFPLPSSLFACEIVKGKVVAVKDGDTITVLKKKKEIDVRLAGIDAPEKKQPYGNRAKYFTSDRVFGKTVKVIVEDEDRDGRKIGEVFYRDTSLNEELVAEGLAWVDPRFSSSLGLAALQREAKARGIGIWKEPSPQAPWEYRKESRSSKGNDKVAAPSGD